jgi:predicted DNA-binding transcriptional regulator AlpA
MADSRERHHVLPPNLAPLGLRREAAAEFVSVSPTKFDELVRDGRMPRPMHIDGIVCWDVDQLRAAWARLRDQTEAGGVNLWDRAMRIKT